MAMLGPHLSGLCRQVPAHPRRQGRAALRHVAHLGHKHGDTTPL